MVSLSHNWDDSKPKNKSVYLSNAGLWTACQESRDVVTKDWNKHPRPENDVDIFDCCSVQEAVYYFDHFWTRQEMSETFMFYSRVDDEHWRQTVYPVQDLFCIAADDWDIVARNWESCIISCPYSIGISNIAIEFDPSWNIALENKTSTWFIEDVPASLEFLLKLLFGHIRENRSQIIKLIVRDVEWILLNSTTRSQAFDSDDEYLEVSADEVEPYYDLNRRRIHIPRNRALRDFFNYLDEVYYERLLDIYCEENYEHREDYEILANGSFDIRHSFSVLVPRANQIEK